MTTENLALWKAVERTDPTHVKPITGKAYNGTSPKPYYLIQKATETFGPCGIGWGFKVLNERVEDGAEPGERIHLAHVQVWYMWDGKRGEVEHVGGTPFSGKRVSGKTYADEDANKKSVTDALVKALSLIGFAGDIFMGRYDDSKYVNEIKREIEQEKQEPKVDEGSIKTYIAAFQMALQQAQDVEQLRPMWKDNELAREKLNIVPGSHIYTELNVAWATRGKELAVKKAA